MAPARDNKFLPEIWGLYSVGTLWVILRFVVRLRLNGIKGLKFDDGLALIALFAWTYTCAIIQITYYTGTNSDFTNEEIASFDQRKSDEVKYGSQLFLGSWYAYITLIFSLKGIVIILYYRIFFQRWQIWVLRITTFLCVSGFCGITIALSLRCLPYSLRWQIVPRPPIQCTASPNVLITTSCINAVTDVFLLSVPISLLWNLNKPLRTRIAVFILLASGVFVLAACIIRVSLTVVPNIFVLNIARWGVREFCIAIVAVNSASLRPMFRKSFWKSRKSAQDEKKQNTRVFASIQQRFSRRQNRNQALNSTSAGASTIDIYVQRELGDEEFVFEDPDYQVTNGEPSHPIPDVTMGDIDLEKGNLAKNEITRVDSGFPRGVDLSDRGGDTSSGDVSCADISCDESHSAQNS